MCSRPLPTAACSGALPTGSSAVALAPPSRRYLTTVSWPLTTASCSALRPSVPLTLAPNCTRERTTMAWPLLQERTSGDLQLLRSQPPFAAVPSGDALATSSASVTALWPARAA